MMDDDELVDVIQQIPQAKLEGLIQTLDASTTQLNAIRSAAAPPDSGSPQTEDVNKMKRAHG